MQTLKNFRIITSRTVLLELGMEEPGRRFDSPQPSTLSTLPPSHRRVVYCLLSFTCRSHGSFVAIRSLAADVTTDSGTSEAQEADEAKIDKVSATVGS